MLVCPNCNHQQAEGKFCEECGTMVQNVTQTNQSEPSQGLHQSHESASQASATVASGANQAAPNFQSNLKEYGNYLLTMLKNPTTALKSGENHFVYGLINMAIFIVGFALGLYYLINSIVKTVLGIGAIFGGGFGSESLPFFGTVTRIGFFALIFIVIGFLSAFAMIKLAKNTENVKVIIAQYGGLIVPFAALTVLSVLTGLASAASLTLILAIVALIFVTFIVPALLVFSKGASTEIQDQKVYFSVAASAIAMVIAYLVIRGMIVDFVEKMQTILNFL